MQAMSTQFESDCQAKLDKYFAAHPNPSMQKQTHKTLRLLRASEKPLKGNTSAWAAGILYAVANDARIPFGVPGFLNSEFEAFMGVRMEMTQKRAARVRQLMIF